MLRYLGARPAPKGQRISGFVWWSTTCWSLPSTTPACIPLGWLSCWISRRTRWELTATLRVARVCLPSIVAAYAAVSRATPLNIENLGHGFLWLVVRAASTRIRLSAHANLSSHILAVHFKDLNTLQVNRMLCRMGLGAEKVPCF